MDKYTPLILFALCFVTPVIMTIYFIFRRKNKKQTPTQLDQFWDDSLQEVKSKNHIKIDGN